MMKTDHAHQTRIRFFIVRPLSYGKRLFSRQRQRVNKTMPRVNKTKRCQIKPLVCARSLMRTRIYESFARELY